MRRLICSLALVRACCWAWDTPPHQQITKAALNTLPKQFLSRLGAEVKPLIEIYCIYPDRYEEMEHFGFVRKSPGPRTASEIRLYCVRPDGKGIHSATGDRETDTGSLVYLIERILTNLSGNRSGEAARYAGVLSHFIADSFSPPHAVAAEELLDMVPRSARAAKIDIHQAIERSLPEFVLGNRRPRTGANLLATMNAVLDQCYSGARQNQKDLPSMVKAACARDEQTLDSFRLRAGIQAAETLADALYALLSVGAAAR